MKLADLKRLPIGTELRNVRSLMGPTPPEKQLRKVVKIQSNAILFQREGTTEPSYLFFPKASEFESTENGFRVFSSYEGREGIIRELAAEYEFA